MKKILLILLVLIISGCGKPSTLPEESPNPPVDVITKEDILKEEAVKLYSDKALTSNNIGTYGTKLISILPGLQNASLFDACDADNTRISYTILDKEGVISSRLTLIFVCDGKTTKYYYDSLTQEEPTRIYESNNN